MASAFAAIATLASLAWVYLAFCRGGFWRADRRLPDACGATALARDWPAVAVVIPARDEAQTIGQTVASLLAQDYPGKFSIVMVDDGSTDGTAEIARAAARTSHAQDRLVVATGAAPPGGWTGKLWAMEQGTARVAHDFADARYILFTDADIEHARDNMRRLVAKATEENLALVSLMVRLSTVTFWEKLLMPAFVFFFQKLYPFPWVNDRQNTTAAAAGGCMLVDRGALSRAGGIASFRNALIDDCALARRIKSAAADGAASGIWLGLTEDTRSLRPYPRLADIWDMVARTAYTQLDYSPFLLLGTILGMVVVYLVPPMATIGGLFAERPEILMPGIASWAIMAACYAPTLDLYRVKGAYAASLPAAGFLYALMTLSSAWRHARGRGGAWKGRTYAASKDDRIDERIGQGS